MKLLDNTEARINASNHTHKLYTVCSDDYQYLYNFTNIADTIDAFERVYFTAQSAKLAKLPHLAENFNTIEELRQLIPEYFI